VRLADINHDAEFSKKRQRTLSRGRGWTGQAGTFVPVPRHNLVRLAQKHGAAAKAPSLFEGALTGAGSRSRDTLTLQELNGAVAHALRMPTLGPASSTSAPTSTAEN